MRQSDLLEVMAALTRVHTESLAAEVLDGARRRHARSAYGNPFVYAVVDALIELRPALVQGQLWRAALGIKDASERQAALRLVRGGFLGNPVQLRSVAREILRSP